MRRYEFYYYGLGGDPFEGYITLDFTEEEFKRIKEDQKENCFEALDDSMDLKDIYKKAIAEIADWELSNTDNLAYILENYSVKNGTDKDAMINYLTEQWVHILYPQKMLEDLDKDDEE